MEQVVFCPPTELQIELYKNVNLAPILSGQAEPLAAITKLKKICNHPALLYQSGGEMYDDPEEVAICSNLLFTTSVSRNRRI